MTPSLCEDSLTLLEYTHASLPPAVSHPSRPMTRGHAQETGGIAPVIGFASQAFHHGKHLAADTQRPLYSRVWQKAIHGITTGSKAPAM